ncbi:MAG: alcohol dehydrogenase catalytic domain-containing protein [Actinomycetota bacterium]|nr:alcohol dehydrogenase catalytic domain-containing protein [Actinomycetota bacterium]
MAFPLRRHLSPVTFRDEPRFLAEHPLRAVVYAGPGRVAVEDVPLPQVQERDDVVVEVARTAICGSDLHLLHGKTPGMSPGSVIGHEFTGRVAEAGPDVTSVRQGDLVLGSFLVACGSCGACSSRRFNFCERRRALGLGALAGDLDGAQAEYVRVPSGDVNLKRLPHDLDEAGQERVLFAGDVLATGFYAAALGEVASGESAAVVGAGPVGLFCALAARSLGARVVVIDADPARARFARDRYDLDALALEPGANAWEELAAAGPLPDVVFEAVGALPAFKSALRCARDGGRVVVVGVYGAERYDLPMGMVWVRGLQLRFAGMANVQAHWDAALAAVAKGDFDPSRMITHRLALEEAEKGYELFAAREAMKVVMTPR